MLFLLGLLVPAQDRPVQDLIAELSSDQAVVREHARREIARRPNAKKVLEERIAQEKDPHFIDELKLAAAECDREADRQKLRDRLSAIVVQRYEAFIDRAMSDDPRVVDTLLREPLPATLQNRLEEMREIVIAVLRRDKRGDAWDAVKKRALGLVQIAPPSKDSIAAVTELLAADGRELRVATLRALATMEAQESAAKVAELLKDAQETVREEALHTLAELGARSFASNVAALVADKNPTIRREAATTLGRLDSTEHAKAMVPLLADDDAGVRRQAVWALGALHAPDSTPAVLKLLDDKDADVQRQAMATLAELGAKESADTIVQLAKQSVLREAAIAALGRLGARSKHVEIREYLRDGSASVRATAVGALAEMASAEATADIAGLLSDADPWVRRTAAEALGTLAAKDYAAPVAAALEDPEPYVALAVIRTLGILGSTQTADAVAKYLDPENFSRRFRPSDVAAWGDLLRAQAVATLGRLGAQAFAGRITGFVGDRSKQVRQSTARALAQLGGLKYREELLQLLSDEEPSVVLHTTIALAPQASALLATSFEPPRRVTFDELARTAKEKLGIAFEVDREIQAATQRALTFSGRVTLERAIEDLANRSDPPIAILVDEKGTTVRLVTCETARTTWRTALKK